MLELSSMIKSRIDNFTKEQLEELVKSSNSFIELSTKLGYYNQYNRVVVRTIKELQIDFTHFKNYKNRGLNKDGLRKCLNCLEIKSFDDFHNHKSATHGKQYTCKNCSNKPKIRSENYKKNKRSHQLKSAFGINLEEYEILSQSQNNVCAICKTNNTNKRLAVDHCHKTGKIRGLLCGKCNTGIGLMQDNIHILQSAINYLELNS